MGRPVDLGAEEERLDELLDTADAGDSEAGGALRLLTPLFKGYFTERARISGGDAMEIRGGNGFIEDWPDARLLRDVSVHAIWEGSGNVIALDALRALDHGALSGYVGDTERRAEAVSGGGPAAALGSVVLDELHRIETQVQARATIDGTFTVPPATIEAMYAPDTRGRTASTSVTVTK